MGVLPYRGGSWRRLEASCRRLEAVLRVVGGVLKRLGAVLARSWGVLSASWGGLGASWGVLGLSWPPESHPTRGQKTLFFLCFFMVIASVRLLRATFAQHRLPGCTGAVLVPSRCRLGPFLGRLWCVLGRLGCVLGRLGAVLATKSHPTGDQKTLFFICFLRFSCLCVSCGRSSLNIAFLTVLAPSLGRLGACLGRLGAFWGRLGGILGRLGGVLGRLGRVLGRKRWPTWLQLGSQNGPKSEKT